jgi:hypothetical protein
MDPVLVLILVPEVAAHVTDDPHAIVGKPDRGRCHGGSWQSRRSAY